MIDGSIVGVEVGVGLEVGDGLGVGVDVWASVGRAANMASKKHGIRTNKNLVL